MCFEQRVMFLWLISVWWKPRLLGKWAVSVVLSHNVSIRQRCSDPFLALKRKGGRGKWLLLATKQPYSISTLLFNTSVSRCGMCVQSGISCWDQWCIDGCNLEAETIQQWLEVQWTFNGPLMRCICGKSFKIKVQRSISSSEKLNCPLILYSGSRDQNNHSGENWIFSIWMRKSSQQSAVKFPFEAAFTAFAVEHFCSIKNKVRKLFQSSRRPPSSPQAFIHGSKQIGVDKGDDI